MHVRQIRIAAFVALMGHAHRACANGPHYPAAVTFTTIPSVWCSAIPSIRNTPPAPNGGSRISYSIIPGRYRAVIRSVRSATSRRPPL